MKAARFQLFYQPAAGRTTKNRRINICRIVAFLVNAFRFFHL
jgi:hypothetical protein